MSTVTFILVACFIFGYGLVSKRLEESPLTPPLVFVGLGIVFGPSMLDWLHLDVEHGAMHLLAELTLILVLDQAALPSEGLVFQLVMLTVSLSVIAHGVSAAPLARRYAARASARERCPEEHRPVAAHPLRRRK